MDFTYGDGNQFLVTIEAGGESLTIQADKVHINGLLTVFYYKTSAVLVVNGVPCVYQRVN